MARTLLTRIIDPKHLTITEKEKLDVEFPGMKREGYGIHRSLFFAFMQEYIFGSLTSDLAEKIFAKFESEELLQLVAVVEDEENNLGLVEIERIILLAQGGYYSIDDVIRRLGI